MAVTSDYLNRLLDAVTQGLGAEQGSVGGVHLEHGAAGLTMVMEAGGRRLAYDVAGPVYHYEPDGDDVSRHATWLVQLFDEEAR